MPGGVVVNLLPILVLRTAGAWLPLLAYVMHRERATQYVNTATKLKKHNKPLTGAWMGLWW